MTIKHTNKSALLAGTYATAFRWVIGWTYFSAFWRRLILDNKLIPEEAGYIGEKFNHFLPNALGIKPIIEYLVLNPEALHFSMIAFTIIEAIVGLCLILGFFTRLMSIGVFGLAMGILLGSGWIGTTCLDEWQIGVLGVAGGFLLFLSGGGYFSLDNYFKKKKLAFALSKSGRFLGSDVLKFQSINKIILFSSIFILGLTLFTNQYFHGGVFGNLHNKSVRPKVEISNIQWTNSTLTFEVYRVEGADVYGSFLIGIEIFDEEGKLVKKLNGNDLAEFPKEKIFNHYVAKVKPSTHSLIIPLGAKADIRLEISGFKKGYKIKLIDISGIVWEAKA